MSQAEGLLQGCMTTHTARVDLKGTKTEKEEELKKEE